jgi:hypothetical protein
LRKHEYIGFDVVSTAGLKNIEELLKLLRVFLQALNGRPRLFLPG